MDVQAIIDDIDRQFAQMRRVRELFVSIMEGDEPAAKRPRPAQGIDQQANLSGSNPEPLDMNSATAERSTES